MEGIAKEEQEVIFHTLPKIQDNIKKSQVKKNE